MTIHHTHHKKAEKAGYTLTEIEGDMVQAFWPKRNLSVYGASSSDAMQQMQAAMALGDDYKVNATSGERLVTITRRDDGHTFGPVTPTEAHKAIVLDKNAEFVDPTPYTSTLSAHEQEATELASGLVADYENAGLLEKIERSEKGIALDGAIAYKEGTPAADCPFNSEDEEDDEYEKFVAWNEAWDEAADAATDEEAEKGGSVVSEKYRTKYAELGHPTHCGDWLAELLNNLCITKEGTDLARFEAICLLNGVDTSKYRRSGVGWQGRIRMTGRNLLSKKVYLAGGVLKSPVEGAEGIALEEFNAPAEWMATQRFKMPKADQSAPIPTPAAA